MRTKMKYLKSYQVQLVHIYIARRRIRETMQMHNTFLNS